MSRQRWSVCAVVGPGLVLALGGCGPGLFPPPDVELPAEVRFVLEHAAQFNSPPDDPLEAAEPGTVIDDLGTLTGCWGGMLTESDLESPLALFVVYHFDADQRTYTCYSFPGLEQGELLPMMPLISVEEGTFTVASDNTLQFAIRRMLVNMDVETGQLTGTLREVPPPGGEPEPWPGRTALVTLAGDRLLEFIGVGRPEQVDPAGERAILYRFDCPAAP